MPVCGWAGETVERIVSFQPPIPGPQTFELTCKTLAGRTIRLPCRASGVQPDISISHNKISFPATPLRNTSTCSLSLRNNTDRPQVCVCGWVGGEGVGKGWGGEVEGWGGGIEGGEEGVMPGGGGHNH